MHYFDHNATTPLGSRAREAWLEAQDKHWQNPSSPYGSAARAYNELEEAHNRLFEIIGGDGHVVFNSGATEANNTLFAYLNKVHSANARIIVSAIEHPSVIEPAKHYFGERCILVNPQASGVLTLESIESELDKGEVVLVSVMAANNETGVIQPWKEIAAICRIRGIAYHCDASQWLGKLPAADLGEACDFVTGAAHKFGGPKASGFIKMPETANGYSSFLGGSQEGGSRAGTENYAAIAAMLAALEAHEFKMNQDTQDCSSERDRFEEQLKDQFAGICILGQDASRLWNTSTIIMPKHENTRWVTGMDRQGFEISTGSACATAKRDPSHVLAAMGISTDEAKRVVRVSGGWNTPADAWESLAEAFKMVWDKLESEAGSKVIQL